MIPQSGCELLPVKWTVKKIKYFLLPVTLAELPEVFLGCTSLQ